MWFLFARKAPRTSLVRAGRNLFSPRLEALEDRSLLSAGPGALDTAFGGPLAGSSSPSGTVLGPSGIIVTNPSNAMVVYPATDPFNAGKIVIGGFSFGTVAKGFSGDNFALERFNADGSLDDGGSNDSTPGDSFGNGGLVTTLVGNGASGTQICALAYQSDGNIVAVGQAHDRNYSFAVARYKPDGRLDTSFGNAGIVLTYVVPAGAKGASTGNEVATSVAIQGDGKIDVGGYSSWSDTKTKTTFSDFTLLRYNANGSLDTGFGSGGIVTTPHFSGNTNDPEALVIQPGGKIILAGRTNNGGSTAMAVAQYTAAGALDSSFGGSGVVTLTPPNATDTGAFGVFVQASGAIVLSGYGYYPTEEQTLARLTPSGALDTSFGNSGFVLNPYLFNGHNIVQAANGDLLTAGTAGNYANVATYDQGVAAFLPNGAADTTFGPNATGTSISPVTAEQDGVALALRSDGKIVVGGNSYNATNATVTGVALARFLLPGAKISSFTAAPNPVTAGSSLTLTVSGILNGNPTSTFTNVVFYLDFLGGTPLTVVLTNNVSGTWTYSFDTIGLASGAHSLFAEAVDSNGVFSDPLALSLIVL